MIKGVLHVTGQSGEDEKGACILSACGSGGERGDELRKQRAEKATR